MLTLRLADERDLDAINAIYNHYVPISTATYDNELMSADQRRSWFTGRLPIHPVTIAERDSRVVGWGALGPFRAKPGYRHTVENSVYIHPDCQRTGVGAAILADLIDRARKLGLRAIVAGVDAEQPASLALHVKFGFVKVAHFHEIGYKFDRWLDVIFLELLL